MKNGIEKKIPSDVLKLKLKVLKWINMVYLSKIYVWETHDGMHMKKT